MLAEKAAVALPGIIGSVVSWLFSKAGQVVGFVAEHLWTLLVVIAVALVNKIKKN